VVSSSYDRSIRFWDAQIGTPIGEPLTGHDESVMSVSFSPDGRRIVSGSEDNTLRLWDTHAGTPIGQPFVGHEGAVLSAVFSPDGNTIVSASRDESIRLWNAHTGSPIGLPIIGHKLTVHSALFSPDGNLLVSASADKTVRLWNAHTGRPVGQPITGHTDRVRRAVFSPDGKTIASASNDKTIRNWDVALASLDSTSKTSGGDNVSSQNSSVQVSRSDSAMSLALVREYRITYQQCDRLGHWSERRVAAVDPSIPERAHTPSPALGFARLGTSGFADWMARVLSRNRVDEMLCRRPEGEAQK